jgi:hypothetical protein
MEENFDDSTKSITQTKNFANIKHHRRNIVPGGRCQYPRCHTGAQLGMAGISLAFHRHRRMGLAPIKLKI